MDNITTPFIAFVMNEQTNTYQVLLVNPTMKHFARIVTLTGAYMSMDDDLVETSKAVKERGELLPVTTLEIESGEIDDLEFRVWYHLDIYEQGANNPVHTWFQLPSAMGALCGYAPEHLPVLTVEGQPIALAECKGSSIHQEIETMVMESQVHRKEQESESNGFEQAQKLVIERITGFRKGTTDVPNWTHSINVQGTLKRHGFSDDVITAGLLHDIVEDGNTSLADLQGMGYSNRVISLVDLCSHNPEIAENDARWVTMMSRLVHAQDRDAWAIKVADISDNLRSCHTMSKDRQRFMRQVKGELMLRLSKPLLGDHQIWQELNELIGLLDEESEVVFMPHIAPSAH